MTFKPQFTQEEAEWILNAIDLRVKHEGLVAAKMGIDCAAILDSSKEESEDA